MWGSIILILYIWYLTLNSLLSPAVLRDGNSDFCLLCHSWQWGTEVLPHKYFLHASHRFAPCLSWQRCQIQVIFKAPSNSNHSLMLWFETSSTPKVHPKKAIFIQSFYLEQRTSTNEPSLSHWPFRIKSKQLALSFPADFHWGNMATRQTSVPHEYHSIPLKSKQRMN